MAKGASKIAGGGGGSIGQVLSTLNNNGLTAAGDMLNNMTQPGDYFMFQSGNNTIIYGKTYNDEYYNLEISGGVANSKMDSDAMVNRINDLQNMGGSWTLGKYKETYWTETPKGKNDSGQRSAVVIAKLPTNVKSLKTGSANGYNIYELRNAPKFFKKVAVKK